MTQKHVRFRPERLLRAAALTVLLVSGTDPSVAAQARDAGARTRTAQAEHVVTVEGISEYRLPNGLRIVLFPDASRPTTTVNITYFVGSRHESYGETGMAHLLEHLLFKGTPTHPNIPQELTERGGRANGTTWFDRTNYFITFPSTDDNLEWAIRLEADRMVNSFVRQEDLDSEMTVVRNEWEASENGPSQVLLSRTTSLAYLWHGYGRATIGARSDIENVPIERIEHFYRRYYQPDNAILVIAGGFDEARALRRIEEHFGALAAPDRSGSMALWETYTREPVQDGERVVTLSRTGDLQHVIVAYHSPPTAHEEFAAVDLLAHVLGNAPSGRLHQALVETGIATSVSAWTYRLHEPGILFTSANVPLNQSIEEARTAITRVLDELVTRPPTDEEVERARVARLRDMQHTLANSERVGVDLTEWAATGDWRLMFIHRDRLRATTPADVAHAAGTYLVPANRTVGLFIPESEPLRAEIPDVPDIATLVADYRGTETLATGEAFEATHENIESRIQRLELDNGFRVALLPKQTRGGTVLIRWRQRIGNETDLMGRAAHGYLAGRMLMRGTRVRSRQQLLDALARLETRMVVYSSATDVTANIETTRENLMPVLDLLREVLREPAFDAAELETLKRERLSFLEMVKSEPQGLGSRAFSRHLSPRPPGHPDYIETYDEAIEAVRSTTLDQVRGFYNDFYGAGAGGGFTLLGDFDPHDVEAFVRDAFGDWPMRRAYEHVPNPYREVQATTIEIDTPDKANAFFFAGSVFPLRDDDPDYPALALVSYIMGGGFLNSRLATRVRGQEGISYSVGARIVADEIDERGIFGAFATFAPENADRLVAAIQEEIERALRDGFTAEEVEAAKRGWLQSRDVARGTDSQLIAAINDGLFLDRTLFYDAEFDAKVRALTPDELHQAMRRHIDPAAITIVKAGDFADAAGTPEQP